MNTNVVQMQIEMLVNFGEKHFNWDNEQFKIQTHKGQFEHHLNRIEASIVKTRTNLVSEPIEPNRQLGLTIYKLAWDGFHVYVCSKLKNRATLNIDIQFQTWGWLGIISVFLKLAVGAPGSTHDAIQA